MRSVIVALFFCLAAVAVLDAQTDADAELEAQLRSLFPDADSFSGKEGSPPHYKAYGPTDADGRRELLGLAFWTTELDPLERAFDGPIKMLVGMDTVGVLTGAIVTEHREPYGYFSIDLPEFEAQFDDKSVRDPFRVGQDIDAVTRATVTLASASRAVRNSARRIARAHLRPPGE